MFTLTATSFGTIRRLAFASEHERQRCANNLIRNAVLLGLTVDHPNDWTLVIH